MTIVRTLRLLVILGAAGVLSVVAADPAAAGGPTSVLLASPYSDSAAALYYTDNDYADLTSLLGGTDLPESSAQVPANAAGAPYVTVTWLIHDVTVWRLDRIFLIGDDVWFVTSVAADGAPLTAGGMYPNQTGAAGAVWHRPTDTVALTSFLDGHGLTAGAASAAERPTTVADRPTPVTDPTDAATPTGAAATSVWAIGGLIAGLLIGGAAVRLTRTRQGTPSSEPARMVPLA